MDDLGREPEQASLDRFQGCQRLRRETTPVRWRGHYRTGRTLDRCAHLRGLLDSRGRDAYEVMVNQGVTLTLRERSEEGNRGARVLFLPGVKRPKDRARVD